MKLLELQLLAYGPFTNRTLDLSGGHQGFHVLFGPNEAGKSSALRALRCLLYGIPVRSTDAFLHPYDRLRVGGRLRRSDGAEVAFVRRKGAKNTLLSPGDESTLPDDLLTPFLEGVGEEIFTTVFGIDHDALVRGGRAILDQQGEVGQALFSAGLGTDRLRSVLRALEDEARELFLPGGSKPKINQVVSEHKAARSACRDASLSARLWAEHDRALRSTEEELGHTRRALADLRRDENRLLRVRRVLPRLAEREAIQALIGTMDGVTELPEDFGLRRREALDGLHHARSRVAKAEEKIEKLKRQIRALSIPREILEESDAIEGFAEGLGAHAKAAKDTPRLEAERDTLHGDAMVLLRQVRRDVPPERVEALRETLAQRTRIQSLGARRQALAERVARGGKTIQQLEKKRERLGATLQTLGPKQDPKGLRQAAEIARRDGNLDARLGDLTLRKEALHKEARAELGRFPLWSGSLEAVEGLPVPDMETVERFEARYDALASREERIEADRETQSNELAEVERHLEGIRLAGLVPTEEELQAARGHRERGWRLLRGKWVNGTDVSGEERAYAPQEPLPDAYEKAVLRTDEVADRLRREADRVHKQADYLSRKHHLERSLEDLETKGQERSAERIEVETAWRQIWAPCRIDPLSPREMRSWLFQWGKLRDTAAALRQIGAEREALALSIGRHREALLREIEALHLEPPASGEELTSVLRHGERLAEALEAREREREKTERDAAGLQEELEAARVDEALASQELADWQESWSAVIQGLGLPLDATPEAAHEALERISDLFSKLDATKKLDDRLRLIAREAAAFEDAVRSFVQKADPALLALPVAEAVRRLKSTLTKARQEDIQRKEWEEQAKELADEVLEANATIREMEGRLTRMRGEARCETNETLEPAERASDTLRGWNENLRSVERQLVDLGEGAGIAELVEEARGVDADELPGRIQSLQEKIAELDAKREELSRNKGELVKTLSQMDGGARAADAAEREEQLLAEMRGYVERYMRARLAARILSDEIERYRAQNQDPLVVRAGALFEQLTCGAFVGLQTDLDEGDHPVLLGVRPDGRRLGVSGMSSGTRDQLYLALRLATIEKYLKTAEPLPFVVDDILVNFDDPRSEATLAVLSELSRDTQVLLFTHHQRLVEQVTALEGSAEVFVHGLP